MRILIFVQQLNSMGGIERVVIEHLRLFREHGVAIKLLVEKPITTTRELVQENEIVLSLDTAKRKWQLEEIIKSFRPEAVIFHGTSHKLSSVDVSVVNSFAIPSICVVHFPFNSAMALESRYNGWVRFIGEVLDKCVLATVSRIDALWWRSLGCRAFHVQNPFVKPKNVDLSRRTVEDGTTNLIWVGRQAEQKQPSAALAAFARVHAVEPKTRMMMIGGSDAGWKPYKDEAKRLGCLEAVQFISERPDINEYWAKADIHLLTSVVESFCLVWAEAKAAAIPTVMYELPYLELAEDHRGYIAVDQRNVTALADAMLTLVRNPERRRAMGLDAKASLDLFNDEAVWTSWKKLFDALKSDETGREVPEDFKTVVSQIYSAYAFRKEKHQWEENMEADFRRLTGGSLRPLARFLEHCVDVSRRLKYLVVSAIKFGRRS